MQHDHHLDAPPAGALAPLAPGPLIDIAQGALKVAVAPQAGGRIAQIAYRGIEQLVGYDDGRPGMISWGSYPMVPWAGRIRRGKFDFQGSVYQLPLNLEEHAIHGVAFGMPWRIEAHSAHHVELSLALPQDERWPFGGTAYQRIEAEEDRLKMTLSVRAESLAMPAAIGWHPWFRKPERVDFSPHSFYPRDEEGIAICPLAEPPTGPWDDCFLNREPVIVHRAGQRLRLTSDCDHWVVYDETEYATCLEPQTGPPDAFNLKPVRLSPGEELRAWFLMEWL